MKSLEIEGKTVDEAIEKACKEFHVGREKLSIEILTEKTPGLLGLVGSKKVKIRATLLSLDEALLEQPSEFHVTLDSEELPTEESKSLTRGEDLVLRAKTFLQGIIKRMGLEGEVVAEERDDQIVLTICGNGSGLLIGKRGQNLDALQYLVNKAILKSANEGKMIVVDMEDYRRRREEALISLAKKLGEKVKKTKKAISLSNLNAHNRRIIHMALKGDPELTTKSRGEGELRKLIIVPTKKG